MQLLIMLQQYNATITTTVIIVKATTITSTTSTSTALTTATPTNTTFDAFAKYVKQTLNLSTLKGKQKCDMYT